MWWIIKVSNAKWKLGNHPKRRGRYIFAIKLDGKDEYWLYESNYDPAKECCPFSRNSFRDNVVAYRHYPYFDEKIREFLVTQQERLKKVKK